MRIIFFVIFIVFALFIFTDKNYAQEAYLSDTDVFSPLPLSTSELPSEKSAHSFKSDEEFAQEILRSSSEKNALDCVDTHCKELAEQFRIKLLNYRIWALEHNEKSHRWQMRSGRRIFYCVLFIVAFGLVLSLLQFLPAWKRDLKGIEDAYAQTELSVSESSFKVSSPVVGLIILALSLGFFVAYLKMVYPLSYASSPQATMVPNSK